MVSVAWDSLGASGISAPGPRAPGSPCSEAGGGPRSWPDWEDARGLREALGRQHEAMSLRFETTWRRRQPTRES